MKHQNECCTKELTFYLESNEEPLKGFFFFLNNRVPWSDIHFLKFHLATV